MASDQTRRSTFLHLLIINANAMFRGNFKFIKLVLFQKIFLYFNYFLKIYFIYFVHHIYINAFLFFNCIDISLVIMYN